MSKKRICVAVTAALFALPTAAASAATQYVAPSGNDGAACTTAAPCKTFNRAIQASQPGDTVSVAAGSYGSQSISATPAAPGVTLKAAGSVALSGGLSVSGSNVSVVGPIAASTLTVNGGSAGARNVVVDGLTVDHGGASGSAAGYVASADGVTIRNTEFKNNVDSSLVFMDAGPGIHVKNVVYDHDVFHDNKTSPGSGVHTECLYAAAGDDVTVKNSRFYSCRTMDLFVTQAAGGAMHATNYTVENNLFQYSIKPDGSPHAYGLVFRDGSPLNGAVVRNNTLQQPLNLPADGASGAKSYFYSNAVQGVVECINGPVYAYNVTTGAKCAGTGNKQVSSLGLGSDFHPASGSAVVNAGDPANSTGTDADGKGRSGAPDAGAFEYGGTSQPAPTPDPTPTPTPTPTPAGGLVAAYGFGESSGTTVADSSGNGLSGTNHGAATTTSGKFGRALWFNGSSSQVAVPDANRLDLTNGMTLEAWVFPLTTTGWRTALIKERDRGLSYGLYSSTDARKPGGSLFTTSEQTLSGIAALPLQAWSHIAATFDGATERFYVNGTQVGSKAVKGPLATSTGSLRIGGSSVFGEWFSGRIDEVRVYDKALDATQIKGDMTRPVAG